MSLVNTKKTYWIPGVFSDTLESSTVYFRSEFRKLDYSDEDIEQFKQYCQAMVEKFKIMQGEEIKWNIQEKLFEEFDTDYMAELSSEDRTKLNNYMKAEGRFDKFLCICTDAIILDE